MSGQSTAPHLKAAARLGGLADRGPQPDAIEGRPELSGVLLAAEDEAGERVLEAGLRVVTPGSWRLALAGDELCYFLGGRATYTEHNGESIDIAPGDLVHFPSGWTGRCDAEAVLRATYMMVRAPASIDRGATPVLRGALMAAPLKDWGPVPSMIEGRSATAGILLHKGPGGRRESGIWTCSPGHWACRVTADEFCHFIAGRCTYTHESGEVIEIEPDTAAFFPRGWTGACRVHETVRKVYMIR
ncbi:MAG TPA: cupin domain-containing protein [Dongiaceae bacterium]|nr:cupin domain-containing protein [Dongiaceae bacterium]